jgi:hypothetical protein
MRDFGFLETKRRTDAISWFFIAFGLILVLLGDELSGSGVRRFNTDVGSFLSSIGTFIAIVALMQWLYDSYVKRKFFEEVMTTIMATRSLFDCGVMEAYPNSAKINYSPFLTESKSLTLLFAHSKRFLDTHHDELVERVKLGKSISFYCNHQQSAACAYYRQCGRDNEYLNSSISELTKVIGDIDGGRQCIEVIHIDVVPRYALVKFDTCAFLIFSTSSEGQASVPALMVRQNTPLWQFVERDLQRIRENHRVDNMDAAQDQKIC